MTELTDLNDTDALNTAVTGQSTEGNTANMGGMDNLFQATLGMLSRFRNANIFRLRDNTDNTKFLAFDLSGLTTATTRTVTMGDANVTLRPQAWEQISSASYSAVANAPFTGLSAYRMIRIKLRLTVSVDGAAVHLRTSTDNGSNYDAGASDYAEVTALNNGASIAAASAAVAGFRFELGGGVGNAADEYIDAEILLKEFNQSARCSGQWESFYRNAAGGAFSLVVKGERLSTTARNAFRIAVSSGTMTGHILVEGVRG